MADRYHLGLGVLALGTGIGGYFLGDNRAINRVKGAEAKLVPNVYQNRAGFSLKIGDMYLNWIDQRQDNPAGAVAPVVTGGPLTFKNLDQLKEVQITEATDAVSKRLEGIGLKIR